MKEKFAFLTSGFGSGLGSFFSIGCPVCVPAVGALFSSIGLGIMLNMTFLKSLTLLLLGIGLFGLYFNAQKHKRQTFLVAGIAASFAVFAARYLWESTPVMYLGAAILLGNAFLDYRCAKKAPACCQSK